MGAIIDLLFVLIIVLTLFFSFRRGFVKTALGALGFFIAAGVALGFCSSLGKTLADGALGDSVNSLVGRAVDSLVGEENYQNIFGGRHDAKADADTNTDADTDTDTGADTGADTDTKANTDTADGSDDNGEKSALEKLFVAFGAEGVYEDAKQGYKAQVEKGLESARRYIKDGIRKKAVPFCCKLLAFMLLFLGTRILLKIIEMVAGKLTELPVLKQANKLLGGVAGVLLAFLRVELFCLALKLLIPAVKALNINWLSEADLGESAMYRLFEGGNFLSALL